MTGSNALIQFPPFILLNHSQSPAKKKQKQKQKQNKTTNKQTTTTTSSKTSKQFCNKQRNPVYPETSAPSVLSFNRC